MVVNHQQEGQLGATDHCIEFNAAGSQIVGYPSLLVSCLVACVGLVLVGRFAACLA